jgi:glycosyltransferase involved in cell wall biosynthesis
MKSPDRLESSSTSAGPAWKLGVRDWIVLLALSALNLLRLAGLGFAAWAERASARANPRPRGKPLLFYYSQVGWDEVWQRPQEFALTLASEFDVVYFGPLQIHRRLGAGGRRYRHRQMVAAGDARVKVVTPQTFSGTYKKRWIFRLNQWLLRQEAILACPEQPDLVVTNSPFPDWLRETLKPRRLVYDLIDDFVEFAWAPPWSKERQANLLAQTDALVAGTRHLARHYGEQSGRSCEYIASGVDLERWLAADRRAQEGAEQPAEFAPLPRPLIGYAGSISDRLDRDLIASVARRFPEASLAFIGPVHGSFGGELKAPNLHFLGPRSSSDLPDYVCRFDVGLIPFKLNEATRSLNPIKALEYLAAGRPVAATPIPDLIEEFGDVIRLAEGQEAYCDAVADLLALSPERRADLAERGRQALANRTWARQGELYTIKMLATLEAGGARAMARSGQASAPSPTPATP